MLVRDGRRRMRLVKPVAAAAAALVGSSFSATAVIVATSAAPAQAAVSVASVWHVTEPDNGSPTAQSSPMLATVGTHQAAVFGDRAGNVYALDLNSRGNLLWSARSAWAGDSVDTPISQSGNVLYLGAGWAGNPHGGYQALNATTGATVWSRTVALTPDGQQPGVGDAAGLAVVDNNTVFAGSLGQMADTLNAGSGVPLAGSPWFQGDTNFSTAAVAPIGPNGANEIVFGGSQTGNAALHLPQGGHVRVVNSAAQVQCNYATQQPVYSSPAVGRFLAGAGLGIVASTTFLYSGAGQANDLLGFNTGCGLVWDRPLAGSATGSPIVVDALGNHGLQVADTSYNASNPGANGTLTLANGANGTVIWQVPTMGAAMGGPVSVDLGGGHQDLVVAGTGGIEIVDGRNGGVLWSTSGVGYQNSALVTDDANGTVGITAVGYNGFNQTTADHWEVSGSNGSLVGETGGWPMYHHDSKLSGNAGTAALPYSVSCAKPAAPNGYIIATTGGEVYTYGNVPYCGSAINIGLGSGHIVGAVITPDGGGYYLVGDNGGLFTFGDAKYYGAASQYHPAARFVGMAITPQGGYYEVTTAGGLYNFGPGAAFHGSGASYPGGSPVVGIAFDPATGGYWEARSGGGLLSFNAPFKGAATGTATPVVAIAAPPNGSGYWEFTSGGGVFTYGAPQVGTSTGNAIVGAAANPTTSNGFWQVGPTGAVFAHGPAYSGARNGLGIEYPVAGIAGA